MRKTKEYYKRANYALSRTLDKVNDRCSSHLRNTKFSGQGYKRGSYRFIPMTTASVIDQLITAYKYFTKNENLSSLNFLDAGCGIGNIMLLATSVGFWPVYGLELDPEVIKFAKTVNPRWSNIEKQDIMTYTDYNRFDVIYYYCPFFNVEKQVKFEERIENQMRVGALLIANLKKSHKILKDKRFRKINPSMWEKTAK